MLRPLTARQQQLLTYLALNADGPIPRQQIAGRLWPDSTDAQALTNLRREWHHLRENWPQIDTFVDAGTRTLGWRTDASPALDVRDFERAASRGLQGDRKALDEAARLYRGDLLPDCADEWIHADRERLRRQALRALFSAHCECRKSPARSHRTSCQRLVAWRHWEAWPSPERLR